MIVSYRLYRIARVATLSLLLCSLLVPGACKQDALKLRLIYSGDEQGALWAHGCDEQIGGLDRRHTLIQSLSEKHKNILNLHTGNILDPFDAKSQVVYQIALDAFKKMGYDAVCLGPKDLSLPIDTMKVLQGSHSEVPFVCANLEVEGQNIPLFTPYTIQEFPPNSKKPMRAAIVGLMSQSQESEIKYYHSDLAVKDPAYALAKLADDLAQKSDFVVVSFHASQEEAQKLAKEFPWIDVIIIAQSGQGADSAEGSNAVNVPIVIGETTIVNGTPKGESVGVLDIGFDRNKQVISRENQFIQVSEQVAPSDALSAELASYDDMVENYGLDGKAAVPGDQAVHLVYFYKRGCGKCAQASWILRNLKDRYPEVVVEKKSVKENQELLEAMGELYNVPETKLLTTPAIFIGDAYFLDEPDEATLESAIQRYLPTGIASRLPQAEAKIGDAKSRIVSRFQSFGVLTVTIAGLLDGINPCAFATIVLFVSYMSLVGRRRKEILMTGIAFTSAVFVTYFLLGIGALRFLEYLSSFSFISKIVYIVAAIATFVLAILSFYDAYKAKRGKVKEIKLQLPGLLKDRIHKVIRKQVRTSGIIIGSLVIGFVISALELVCTGQVYLPTITFVVGIEGMRIHALLYLLLYNLMFIIPLLIVFGFVYLGTTFVQLGGVFQRHLVKVKLGTGLLFLGLSIWLILSVSWHIG